MGRFALVMPSAEPWEDWGCIDRKSHSVAPRRSGIHTQNSQQTTTRETPTGKSLVLGFFSWAGRAGGRASERACPSILSIYNSVLLALTWMKRGGRREEGGRELMQCPSMPHSIPSDICYATSIQSTASLNPSPRLVRLHTHTL